MTSFNQKLVKLASSAYFLTYLFCVWQNLHNGVLEGVSNQAGWSQVFWPPCRVGVYVLNLLSCVSRFCGCRPYYVDCSICRVLVVSVDVDRIMLTVVCCSVCHREVQPSQRYSSVQAGLS